MGTRLRRFLGVAQEGNNEWWALIGYSFLVWWICAICTSAAEAGEFIRFTAGLKTCSTPLWDI
jgi:hypothetical protein